MFRTAWFFVNLVGYTAYYAIKAILASLLRIPNRPGGVYDHCATRWAKRMVKVSSVEVRKSGFENVPQDRPVVYVCNHQSWFDIWVLLCVVPGHTRFVAKKELAKVPLLGKAMSAAGHIYIDRQNRQAAFSAYDEAASYRSHGRSAVLFAEGTRSRTGELQPFKKGPFVLAIASQVPIIPVYLAGTFTLLPKGSVRINPHPVGILFGEPITTEGLEYDDRQTLMADTRAAVEQLRVDSQTLLG